MHPSVRDSLFGFNWPFEGYTDYMYLDVKGLVTVGVGCLIDPLPKGLPFYGLQGDRLTEDAIRAEWLVVKARQDLAPRGGAAFHHLTRGRLTHAGIRRLADERRDAMVKVLRERFPGWDEMPADAQLGILSMAWAMGPRFRFPRFAAAVRRSDFEGAGRECEISSKGNPGVIPRNNANRLLFASAARVLREGLPLGELVGYRAEAERG